MALRTWLTNRKTRLEENRPRSWKHGEYAFLALIALPLLVRVVFSAPVPLSGDLAKQGRAGSKRAIEPDAYLLRYEAHQIFGCDPEELNPAQLAAVKRSCHCAGVMLKFARHGLDGLTPLDRKVVTEVLPWRYPRLEEFPAYEAILRACSQSPASPKARASAPEGSSPGLAESR